MIALRAGHLFAELRATRARSQLVESLTSFVRVVQFCEQQEPSPRGIRCELWILRLLAFARSSVARVGRVLFSLDN